MVDKQEEKKALNSICYGLYVIGSHNTKGKINAQLANTVFQVTNNPAKLAVAIHKENLTYEFIKASKVFSVCSLRKGTSMVFVGNFGFRTGRDFDKFAKVKHKIGKTGSPLILENTLACFEVDVEKEIDLGEHVLFIGKPCSCENILDGEPLTYDYYQCVLKGKEHKRATHG
ncbi:MAG: flavin reductase family protein [Elusimicrobiaceae bacterium]|jgi:ferric-chelate reductase [NAD(P)H]|nr:flavin reductase family protein [Elusimicrobiaceae bacterium]MBT3955215.1 flavin reductase family protein [Elusimicrobiaceae bacterium]MBT4007784.1 flavin reductase family protein [Elusimicrobiaceae bacterium]MBT4403313.1 flavin reductase family protein [Elusimicrobiaceae bacterium]MBT4440381.1 flavin reductase family protein [Elusimicrobiaceae bacterium]